MSCQIGVYSVDYADRFQMYADVIRVNLELLERLRPIDKPYKEIQKADNYQKLHKALLDGAFQCLLVLRALADPNINSEYSEEEIKKITERTL